MNQITAEPIRVALVGYGYSGRTFHAPLIRAVAGLDLRLVSSRDEDRVRVDLPKALVLLDPVAVATSDEVDLVVIASPNDSHAPLAHAALSAGNQLMLDSEAL